MKIVSANSLKKAMQLVKNALAGKEPAFSKNSGFNLTRTDNSEDSSMKLLTAKGGLIIKNELDDKKLNKGSYTGTASDLDYNIGQRVPYKESRPFSGLHFSSNDSLHWHSNEFGYLKFWDTGNFDPNTKTEKGGYSGSAKDLENGIISAQNTANLKLNKAGDTMTGDLVLGATSALSIKGGGSGKPITKILTNHGNGNVTVSGNGGDLYLGYNNGNDWKTNTVKLERDMTVGGTTVVNMSKQLFDNGNRVITHADVHNSGTGGAGVVYNKIPRMSSSGVLELGRYLDWHYTDDGSDYTTRMDVLSDRSIAIRSSNGVVEIGAKNTSYCHMYTDRPYFYMNKHLQINGANVLTDGGQFGTVKLTNWIRTVGGCGWYSETYGGGWHMTDTTWIRAYNNKPIYTAAEVAAGGNVSAYYSDERMKKDFVEVENVLDKINSIKTYRYTQSEMASKLGYNEEGKIQIGFKACDINSEFPEFVQIAPVNHSNSIPEELKEEIATNPIKTLDYGRMVTVLWKGVQELTSELNSLKEELNQLKNK